MIVLITILSYFVVLTLYSRFVTGRKSSNEAFFRGNRKSPWYMVAFGMVGASISGITFVSVPGMVMKSGMSYLQTCIGFIFGYIAVAFILLPIYYKLNLTTIYTFLRDRVGQSGYKTGASFFLLSKMTGAAARFYVVCMLLNDYVIGPMCPSVNSTLLFSVIVLAMVARIWLYTKSGGIKTLVWTDTLQTICSPPFCSSSTTWSILSEWAFLMLLRLFGILRWDCIPYLSISSAYCLAFSSLS